MNIEPLTVDERAFDQRARGAHQAALQSLSPRVRAQLRLRTRQALSGGVPATTPPVLRRGWIAAPALALALAFALPWPGGRDTADPAPASIAATTPATVAPAAAGNEVEVAAPLEYDPDFYLWLATADAIALASDRP